MKRRSARPFTVEIKQTRTARAPLSEAIARTRDGQSLWHDMPLLEAEMSPETPLAAPVQASPPPEAPSRRILPSLVPMFVLPSESEPREVPVVERLPRVRRPKQLTAKKILAKKISAKPLPEHAEGHRRTVAVAPPVEASAPRPPARPSPGPVIAEPMQSRAARLTRKPLPLAPGERWKRRLPRVLW